MRKIAERKHLNGWTAIVVAESDGDRLVGFAASPSGERHDPPGSIFDGGEDDYSERLNDAKDAAERTILMATGHGDCDCQPWTNGGD